MEIEEKVLKFFEELSRIPRPSGHCGAVAECLCSFAQERGLWHTRDRYDNVIIKKPAAVGREKDPTVMLQGHTDMVAAKTADSDHNFLSDPIKLIYDGDLIRADGTTLGGDDGFAVALMLALLDDDSLNAPALECVFTSDEEVGMIGAAYLDMSELKAKYLINADSEEEGTFTCGCCGGVRVDFEIPVSAYPYSGSCFEVRLFGLAGGHSGTEINNGRLNAIKLMAELLRADCGIVSIELDGKDNAIADSCTAVIKDNAEIVRQSFEAIADEWRKSEPNIRLEITPCTYEGTIIDSGSASRVLDFLRALPFGVQKMCEYPKGLVHTSDNIGIILTENSCVKGTVAVRSVSETDKQKLTDKIEKLCAAAGGKIAVHGDYPGWEYKENSVLRETMCSVWKDMFGTEAKTDIVHAGLECGIILSKMPWLDIVSMGPELHDIHTPRESMSISSVIRCTKFICKVLETIK